MDYESADHHTRGSLFTYPFVDYLNTSRDLNLDWPRVVEAVTPLVKQAFVDRFHGRGYTDDGGRVVQTEQTVWQYSMPPPADGKTYVFGVRVRANSGGGMKVTLVATASPATKMGLEKDDIILTINGRAVNNVAQYNEAVDRSSRLMTVTGATARPDVLSRRPRP